MLTCLAIFGSLCIAGVLYSKCAACTKRLILERLPTTVEVASGEDPEDVWKMEVDRARRKLEEDWPRAYGAW